MAKCPNCKTEINEPFKSFVNLSLKLEAYVCPKCKRRFDIARKNVTRLGSAKKLKEI